MSANTDESLNDVSILHQVFDHCDSIISGQVRAHDLIGKVRQVWPANVNERESKVHFNDLVRRLDPREDNCYVDRETFIKNGVEWLKFLRAKVNNNASLTTSSLASEEDYLDRKSALEATFGSIEAINGASFSGSKVGIIELQEEIEELRNQLKNMFEEKSKISKQLDVTEESNVHLSNQNQELQQRLKNLKVSLDRAMKYQSEIDELKNLAKSKEEEKIVIEQTALKNNSRVSELMSENLDLQTRLDETMDQLSNAMKDLSRAKKSHNGSLDKMKEENESMKNKLNESLAIQIQLENKIAELKSDLTNVRESQYFQRTPSIFDAGESCFLSPSFDEDPFGIKGADGRSEDEGPTANSTPFLKRLSKTNGAAARGSISDEFKILGVREMTPFCEKSALHNESSSNGISKPIITTSEAQTQTSIFDRNPWVDENRNYFIAMFSLGLFLPFIVFTFFGAIELEDGRKLFPILWSSSLPEPVPFLTIKNDPPFVW